ncbi:MAG: YitT family protein, partial [Ferruginibacter sp.]|nr:YitT family protein [Chitinophagaceae bacterium]
MQKLEKELPSWLSYHNAEHTKSVIAAAEYLAKTENIPAGDILLLKTAALFHDAGFLENHNKHEEISCKLAKKYLPGYAYSPEQVEIICRTIMATKLPQTPTNQLEKILCDADLYYMGAGQYTENAEKMFKEFKRTGFVNTKTEWLLKQADFLSSHQYFTATARVEREPQKQIALQEIKSSVKENATHSHKPSLSENIQDACFILFGVVIASFALKTFLVPNKFFDGGITGISLLVHELYHFNLGVVILLFNLPLVIISNFSVGRSFAVKMFISVLLLGVCLVLIPDYAVTSDKLLISIFG